MRLQLIAAASLLALAGTSIAHGAPGTIQRTRHDGFEAMGKAFKGLFEEMKADKPDQAKLLAGSQVVAATAPKIVGWFPKGSGPESGQKTAAKAEIWTQWPEFQKDAEALKTESVKLVAAAKAGDTAAFGAQLKATGAACGACHKVFREKDS